jgi:hypothetical protein
MKAISTLLAILAATSIARADEPDQLAGNLEDQIRRAWYRDDETRAWKLADDATNGFAPAACTETLTKLRNLGVPASRTIELLDESRDLPIGKHALPAVKKACDAIEYAGKVKEVEKWILLGAESDGITNRGPIGHCIARYDEALKLGIKATDKVPERKVRIGRDMVMWSGTIGELKAKHCDAALVKIKAELGKIEGPYRKFLKADKLALALGFNVTAVYRLPDGDRSMDPAKLAAAKIWFGTRTGGNCADGRQQIDVTKYVFDAGHKIVSESTKPYCGEAVYQ